MGFGIHTSLTRCQVSQPHWEDACITILTISRTSGTVLSSGSSYVFFLSSNLQLFQCYALFRVQSHLISVVIVSLGFSFVCVCVCLIILGFFFSFAGSLFVYLSFLSSPPSAMLNQKMVFNPSKAQSLRPA